MAVREEGAGKTTLGVRPPPPPPPPPPHTHTHPKGMYVQGLRSKDTNDSKERFFYYGIDTQSANVRGVSGPFVTEATKRHFNSSLNGYKNDEK